MISSAYLSEQNAKANVGESNAEKKFIWASLTVGTLLQYKDKKRDLKLWIRKRLRKKGEGNEYLKYFNHDAFLVILNFGSTDVSDTGFSWYALSKADDYSLIMLSIVTPLTVHPFYGGKLLYYNVNYTVLSTKEVFYTGCIYQ